MNLDNRTAEERAAYRVLRARAALIKSRRFYSVLVSHVEPVISTRVPTAATNGKQHFWNAAYVGTLTPDELEGVQAHETEHDARHHSTRRGTRDPRKWNEACDFAINGDLIAEGFKLPKNILFDERFRGMSAEDIYRTRELDEQRNQPQPPEDEPQQSEDDKPQDEGEDEGDDAQQPNEQGDDEQSDDGKDGKSEGEGDEPSEDEGNSGQTEGEPDDDADDDATGEGKDGEGGEGPAKSSDTGTDGKGGGEPAESDGKSEPQFSGDTGGCGEVLDSPTKSASENAAQDQQWERIVRQAASMAKAVGQLPGHVSRDVERARNPGQDWREVLRAWFDKGSLQVETWNQPNRRFIGNDLYMPGKQREGINRVVFLVDTSGSMDRLALQLICNETQAALDDGVIDEVVVVYGDVRVTKVDQYRTGDEIDFDPRGGGGTVLKPLFDYVAEQIDDCSLIVCFTDGFIDINSNSPEPPCPVLWAFTGYPETVRRMIANAPWNAPAIDVGEH